MKILYHHRVGSKDGQAVHIEEVVRALRGLGHEVVVVGPRSMERAEFGADAGSIAALKRVLPAALYELLELAYGGVAFLRLWRAYRRERPDAVYERYSLFLLAGAWLKRLTGVPFLLEINAPLMQERSRFGNLANRRLAAWIERITWRSADYVLPVTNVLARFVESGGVNPRGIVVIQNGVSQEFLEPVPDGSAIRRRYGLERRTILGFTGFIREWHGLEQVIDFVADCDPRLRLHLLLVGEGPAVAALSRRTAERGIADGVTFAGLAPRHQIRDYIAAFDIALQPRVVEYASPLKLIEYMALGRAIVAPSTPNIREILNDDEALLFDPAKPADLRAAMEKLCRDASLRARLGAAARSAINRQGLTWESNARRIVQLFDALLRKAGRGSLHCSEQAVDGGDV